VVRPVTRRDAQHLADLDGLLDRLPPGPGAADARAAISIALASDATSIIR
jgi:hypothetical protein